MLARRSSLLLARSALRRAPAAGSVRALSLSSAPTSVSLTAPRLAVVAAPSPSLHRALHASAVRAAETVKVPQMAESITEGTLKQWNKKAGDFVEADEEIAVIETDKIDVTVNAPQSGTITETLANEEDTVTVGQDLFKMEPGDAPAEGSSSGGESKSESKEGGEEKSSGGSSGKEEAPKKSDATSSEQKAQQQKDAGRQSESSEKKSQDGGNQAAKRNEGSSSSSGSSAPKKDPKPSSSGSSSSGDKKGSSSSAVDAAPATKGSRDERRVKMNRMRLRIAERLKQSQNTAASLTTFNEIDMSNLMAFRARHKDRILKEQGVKLGFMGAFARASALALKEIPAANASIEGEGLGDTIVYRDYVDLSVAVSTEKGLVTPVVRSVEQLSILDIEREITALGKKARDNKLTLEDMAGGTFTISNGGVFGSLFGTPILNLPGSAILGMHAINNKPWVVDGKVEIRPIMVVALTYDHRLLDGREAVTFLVRLKQYLEDPAMMAL